MRTLQIKINGLECVINLDEVSSLTSSTPDKKTNIHMKNKDTYIVKAPLEEVKLMWYGDLKPKLVYNYNENNVSEYWWEDEDNSNKP